MLDSEAVLALAGMKADAEYDETVDTDFHPDPETIQHVADTLGVGKRVAVIAADILLERRRDDFGEDPHLEAL